MSFTDHKTTFWILVLTNELIEYMIELMFHLFAKSNALSCTQSFKGYLQNLTGQT